MKRRPPRRRRSNPISRSPFGLGALGLAMVGTGIFAVWAWKNMSERDKEALLPK